MKIGNKVYDTRDPNRVGILLKISPGWCTVELPTGTHRVRHKYIKQFFGAATIPASEKTKPKVTKADARLIALAKANGLTIAEALEAINE